MQNRIIKTTFVLMLCLSMFVSTDVTAKVKGGTWRNMKWSYNTKTKLLKVWGNGYMDYVDDLGEAAGWVQYTKTYDATKLVISGNVKSVGYLCFMDYLKVKEVILPKGIRKISGQAFENCQKLKIITLPYGLKKIKDGAFAMTGIEKLVIPGSVKKLEKWSLADIPDLKELILENGVRELGDSFVDSDTKLRKLRLPKSLKKIDGYAFLHCGIKKLTIPINVEEIGFRAFSSMYNIKTVKIKSTKVKKWGKKLFFSYEPHKIKVVVPKSKYKEYKKIIMKNAGNKKVKVVKAKKF
ncbi:leucine-rich repeat domain-containing protein [Eubacterium xylanophilum]|uniref:leucine-rich repeat domain-containing protein n=1 Tax=Eubacterium xylanophilum TaxID=39497 RepID=UPI00047A2E3E|nr:leucine-rich repeat domain-containing protein [Eubacterium xylanophilum]